MTASKVVLYSTTCGGTFKVKNDITRIARLLDAKQVQYEEVDLSTDTHRRAEMLAGSEGLTKLPQLHVNGRYIGSADEIQELEDWGELNAILQGLTPEQAAAAAATAAGIALAAPAAAPTPLPQLAVAATPAVPASAPQHSPPVTAAPAAALEAEVAAALAVPSAPAAPAEAPTNTPPLAAPTPASPQEDLPALASRAATAAIAGALAAAAAAEQEQTRQREAASAQQEAECAAAASKLAAAAVAAVLADRAAEERLAAAVAQAFAVEAPLGGESLTRHSAVKEQQAAEHPTCQAGSHREGPLSTEPSLTEPAPAAAEAALLPIAPLAQPPSSSVVGADSADTTLASAPERIGTTAPAIGRSAAAAAAVAAIQASAADIIDRALRAAHKLDSAPPLRPAGLKQSSSPEEASAQQRADSHPNSARREAVAALHLAAAELPSPDAESAQILCSPIKLRPELAQLADQ